MFIFIAITRVNILGGKVTTCLCAIREKAFCRTPDPEAKEAARSIALVTIYEDAIGKIGFAAAVR